MNGRCQSNIKIPFLEYECPPFQVNFGQKFRRGTPPGGRHGKKGPPAFITNDLAYPQRAAVDNPAGRRRFDY